MICKYCGKKYDQDDETVFTDNGDLCCSECAETYSMCASCGRIIMGHDNYDEVNYNHYCDHCF